MFDFNIGDIISIEGKDGMFALVAIQSNPDTSIMSYDDYLYVIRPEHLEEITEYEGSLKSHKEVMVVHLTGIHMEPEVVKIEEEPPFEIKQVTLYRIRRKKPVEKVTTVFE